PPLRPISPPLPYTTLFRSSLRCPPAASSRQAGSRPQCCSWHFRLPEFQLRSCYCIVSVCAPMPSTCLRSRQNSRSRQALPPRLRSEEHTSELQSRVDLVCR